MPHRTKPAGWPYSPQLVVVMMMLVTVAVVMIVPAIAVMVVMTTVAMVVARLRLLMRSLVMRRGPVMLPQ